MGVPGDAEIEYWWKRQCSKCKFRAEPKMGILTKGTCNYLSINKHSRGCDMANCERFERGNRIVIKKSAYGEVNRRCNQPRNQSVCACGEWLDRHAQGVSIRSICKKAGISYDSLNKARKRPGAILKEENVAGLARYFGVDISEIRAAEAEYQKRKGETEKNAGQEDA